MPTTLDVNPKKPILLWVGIGLSVLLALPVVAMFAFEYVLDRRCPSVATAEGAVAPGIRWSISETRCEGMPKPLYEVSFGPERGPLTQALASRSAKPVSVERLDDSRLAIRFKGVEKPVAVKHRLSGSPAERIDFDARKP